MNYSVLKQHFGRKQYFEGDKRFVANPLDAQELIAMGLIADDGVEGDEQPTQEEAKAKQAPTPKNKMAKDPENKSE